MSWPVPSTSGSAGPIVPVVVPLPWARRDESRKIYSRPVAIRRSNPRREASIRKAKYASGMLVGLMAVSLAKKIVNSIPLINIVTRPVLDLLPTIVIGPALGAAVVYGVEQGDLLAARHVVREKAQHLKQEFDTVVRDLSSEYQSYAPELNRQLDKIQAPLENVARVASQSVAELERTVVPELERGFRSIEGHARRTWAQDQGGRHD